MLAGCHASLKIETPDGILVQYERWGNQKIDEFFAVCDPNGRWRFGFAGQKSDFEIALEALGAKISVGE